MEWRLNILSVVARGIVMAVIIVGGAHIVRNVTTTLSAMEHVCISGIAHAL
jgi:hypothetical protein